VVIRMNCARQLRSSINQRMVECWRFESVPSCRSAP